MSKYVIGVTGGVGSGKSTVVKYINEISNCFVIDTDSIAKQLYVPGEKVYNEIVKYFSEKILNEDKTINRQLLSSIVFSDEVKLNKLNDICHPETIKKIKELITEHDGFIILESALLFEAKLDLLCQKTIGVVANHEVRKERLMKNRGYSLERINNMMLRQKTNDWYKERVDAIIVNDDFQSTKKQIEKILKNFQKNT